MPLHQSIVFEKNIRCFAICERPDKSHFGFERRVYVASGNEICGLNLQLNSVCQQ